MKHLSHSLFLLLFGTASVLANPDISEGEPNHIKDHPLPAFHAVEMDEADHNGRPDDIDGTPAEGIPGLKSSEAAIWVLDSIYGYYYRSAVDSVYRHKWIYAYDNQWRNIEGIRWAYDTITGIWEYSQAYVRTWDDQGNLTLYQRWLWDDVGSIWYGDYMYEYEYDPNGNRTLYNYMEWDAVQDDWRGERFYERSYDANNNQTQYITYVWDETGWDWVADWRYDADYNSFGQTTGIKYWNYDNVAGWIQTDDIIYDYDLMGNRTLYLYLWWDNTDMEWDGLVRRVTTYDGSGVKSLEESQDWDDAANSWVNDTRTEFSKDIITGNIDEELEYTWNGADWVLSEKIEYEFDVLGYPSRNSVFKWDEGLSDWVSDFRIDYQYNSKGERLVEMRLDWNESFSSWDRVNLREWAYDASGRQILRAYYDSWDELESEWIGAYKYEYDYDANGNLIKYHRWNDWDDVSSDWIPDYQSNYAYNTDNRMTVEERYEWDDVLEQLIGEFRNEYQYDAMGERVSETYYDDYNPTFKTWIGDYAIHYIMNMHGNEVYSNYYTWDEGADDFEFDFRMFYFYTNEGDPLQAETGPARILNLYPNPCRELVYLGRDFEDPVRIRIAGTDGRLVYNSILLPGTDRIDIGYLEQGIYLIEILNGTDRFTGRLLKAE